jgi:hypothetical protein
MKNFNLMRQHPCGKVFPETQPGVPEFIQTLGSEELHLCRAQRPVFVPFESAVSLISRRSFSDPPIPKCAAVPDIATPQGAAHFIHDSPIRPDVSREEPLHKSKRCGCISRDAKQMDRFRKKRNRIPTKDSRRKFRDWKLSARLIRTNPGVPFPHAAKLLNLEVRRVRSLWHS